MGLSIGLHFQSTSKIYMFSLFGLLFRRGALKKIKGESAPTPALKDATYTQHREKDKTAGEAHEKTHEDTHLDGRRR